MKHVSSRLLFDYWNERRGDELAPDRSDIEPGPIRGALSDTFILSFNPLTGHTFRLAGTRVCALMGHELKGQSFIDLWDKPKRRPLLNLTTIVADESVGLVCGALGWTGEGYSVELELLLLPLRLRGRTHVRMIGVLAPLSSPYWLGASPIVTIALGQHRFVGSRADSMPPPVLAIPDEVMARVRHGLVVYDGGQT
jgi:hypothetical protein